MLIATVLCWAAWFFVIYNVDPTQSSIVGFMSFYASLFFSLFGSISLIALWLYKKFGNPEQPTFRLVENSFRDACLGSVVLIVLLYLQGSDLLTIWNFSTFIIFVVLFGAFYLSTKKA